MRKGQFIFNFLRDYISTGTIDNPYPNTHFVLFNISDENWNVLEIAWLLFKKDPSNYKFPKKPFGESIISKQHLEGIKSIFDKLPNTGTTIYEDISKDPKYRKRKSC